MGRKTPWRQAALALPLLIAACSSHPDAEITDPADNPFLRAYRPDQVETALSGQFPIGTPSAEIREWMRLRGAVCEEFDPALPSVRCRYSISKVFFQQRWIIDLFVDRNQSFRYLTVRQALAP